ncbi:MAG: cbb3-type cytochrome oxidase assembly protein CcoS [Pseudomonadota bacterium]
MDVLLILVPCSLVLGLLALAAFVWTLRAHQYDDLEGDAMRALDEHDDAPASRH